MNYLYTINFYKNGENIHKEQLLSVGNYEVLITFLQGEKTIMPGEFVVTNGKRLVNVIDGELMLKFLEEEPQEVVIKDSKGIKTLALHHRLTNMTVPFIRYVTEAGKLDGLSQKTTGEDICILSLAIDELFHSHDIFTNVILTNLYTVLGCVDDETGEITEGFKITVEVKEYEQDSVQ